MDGDHALLAEIEDLLELVAACDRTYSEAYDDVHPAYRESARNLFHYVSLRQRDLRRLQSGLWRRGLSSLGRMEAHALDSISLVRDRLLDALGREHGRPDLAALRGVSFDEAEHRLRQNTRALLGPQPAGRHVYILVTAPDADEVDEAWATELLQAGMDVLRINTAHGTEPEWLRIARTVRAAASRMGRECRVLVDLPGPRLRTTALEEGPRVVRWRVKKDEYGRVIEPLPIALAPGDGRVGVARITVPEGAWNALAPGDVLSLRDARGKRRTIRIFEREADRGRGTLEATAYVTPGLTVTAFREDREVTCWDVGEVPARPSRVALIEGQRFRLVGEGATAAGALTAVGCTVGPALRAVKPGHRVLFDDGKLETVTEESDVTGLTLRVTRIPGGKLRLGPEKGINFPDTLLPLPTLGPEDEAGLSFAVRHGDLLGASFVRDADDVQAIYARLESLGAEKLGVILKIETAHAFAELSRTLHAAMKRYPVGVMIARGDLAVEVGFQRLAELQEEILWLCEAAHLPVIWATQVLDTLARTGLASRAEVTDAAMSVRAECVMLNKGPYVADAVRALADILQRMEHHQYKKRSLYRRLRIPLPSR